MSSTVSTPVLTPSDLRLRKSKSTLRAIVRDGFCLESFRARYSFYKVHPCTLPFKPAEAVPYLSYKYGQQQKRVSGSKGFETKTVTDDGAKRAFALSKP